MSTTDKLTDEAAPDYKGFTEAIMENWAAHGDIDAGEKFDLAVKFNILRPILGGYDPEKHSCEWCDADRGDPWYEMNRRASQAAPARPTEAMLNAARDWSDAKYGKPIGNDAAIGCWNAMLAAAPAPSDALREAAEVAAWNDAIEAADKAAIDRQGRRAMGDGHGNSCYDIGVSDAASAIRALRRAAPTEGEA